MTAATSLWVEELREMLYAERRSDATLARLQKTTDDAKLARRLGEHRKLKRQQVRRLRSIVRAVGDTNSGARRNDTFEGMLRGSRRRLKAANEPVLRNLIAVESVERLERFEVGAYERLVESAKSLDQRTAARLLRKSLDGERAMLNRARKASSRAIRGAAKKTVGTHP